MSSEENTISVLRLFRWGGWESRGHWLFLAQSGGKGSTCESLIILSFFPSLLLFNKSLRTTCFSLVVCFSRVQPLFEILEWEYSSKYGQPMCNYTGMSTLPLRTGFALVNQNSFTPHSEIRPPVEPCGGPTNQSPASERSKQAHNYFLFRSELRRVYI